MKVCGKPHTFSRCEQEYDTKRNHRADTGDRDYRPVKLAGMSDQARKIVSEGRGGRNGCKKDCHGKYIHERHT